MLGAEQRGDNDTQIVRMIDGIEIAWEEQDTCDAARGCTFDVYHLRAGALRAGRGGCEDTEATAGQY